MILILSLFLTVVPKASATTTACADAMLTELFSSQSLVLETGKSAVRQLRQGVRWTDIKTDIVLLRSELERFSKALKAAGAKSHTRAKELLNNIEAWIHLENGTEITLAEYSEVSLNALSMLDHLIDNHAEYTSYSLDRLRPADYAFNTIDASSDGEVFVRLPYRSGVHPLKFFEFYKERIVLWETPIDAHDTDGITAIKKERGFGYSRYSIANHDFYTHQALVFHRFRTEIRSGFQVDFEIDNDHKLNEFYDFLKILFKDLEPQDFKYQVLAYLLWYPVHELGIPPTLHNILDFYEKGIWNGNREEPTKSKYRIEPAATFSRFLGRITDTTNLGRDFIRFRIDEPMPDAAEPNKFKLDEPQIEAIRDELLHAIRAFQMARG